MAIRAVSHVAVGVSDMDRALGFYRDVLGLKVDLDTIEEFPGRDAENPVRRRGVYLRWGQGPDASFIVLDQQLSRAPFGEPPRLFQIGTHHFAFWVDNLDELVERAQGAGFQVAMAPVDADTKAYGEAPGGRVRTVFLHDADGNSVQLDQRLSS